MYKRESKTESKQKVKTQGLEKNYWKKNGFIKNVQCAIVRFQGLSKRKNQVSY